MCVLWETQIKAIKWYPVPSHDKQAQHDSGAISSPFHIRRLDGSCVLLLSFIKANIGIRLYIYHRHINNNCSSILGRCSPSGGERVRICSLLQRVPAVWQGREEQLLEWHPGGRGYTSYWDLPFSPWLFFFFFFSTLLHFLLSARL